MVQSADSLPKSVRNENDLVLLAIIDFFFSEKKWLQILTKKHLNLY